MWHRCCHCWDAAEARLLQEEVELGVGRRVDRDLKQWREDVVQQLLKVLDDPLRLVDVVQARDLQKDPHIDMSQQKKNTETFRDRGGRTSAAGIQALTALLIMRDMGQAHACSSSPASTHS